MKTNYALAAMVKSDDPLKHLCLYEEYPTQYDVDVLIEELETDEEFGMIGMVCDQDYVLQEISGDKLAEIKADLNIPDDL
jgi:hypothetical protein